MTIKRISVFALRLSVIVALAGAAQACVLVPFPHPGGAKGGGRGEATICHKGKKTMTLPAEAVGAHLDHGDRRGPC